MGIETGIQWTDHTFNPWWGCTKVSSGCANCYANLIDRRYGGSHWGPGASRRTFGNKHWSEPLKWDAAASKAAVRRLVFCASMADVFEAEAPAGQLDRLWVLIRQTPNLDWQLLTKRPERIAMSLPSDWGDGYANVWLGTTVEDQQAADKRIPILGKIPAAVRFLSCEPLIGPVDLSCAVGIDWVIAGGEAAPSPRPMKRDWAISLMVQCHDAGIAFFFKQWGDAMQASNPDMPGHLRDAILMRHNADRWHKVGKRAAGRNLMGREWNEFPTRHHQTQPEQLVLL